MITDRALRRPDAAGLASMVNSPKHPDRLLHIQGLRGLFCTIIVLAHADPRPLPGAFAALDGFFLASGLVIGLLLFREQEKTQRVELITFYLRRGRRLLPNLAAMLIATAAATLLLLSPFGAQDIAVRTGLFASFQLGNFDLYQQPSGYYDVGSRYVPLLHTWSLSVEEQIYLFLPATMAVAFVVAARLQRSGIKVFAVVVALSSAASFALFSNWSRGAGPGVGIDDVHRAAFYFPVARWWEVGIGMLLACWYVSRGPLPRRLAGACALLGLVGLLTLMAFPVAGPAHRTGPLLLVPLGALTLILLGCRGHSSPAARFLDSAPLVWLGDRAYSWYLWHYPVIVFARIWFGDNLAVSLVAAVLSFGIAWAAYELLEKRLRYAPRGQSRRAFVRGTSAVVACSLLAPAAAFALVGVAGSELSELSSVSGMGEQVTAAPMSGTLGCSDPIVPFDPVRCTLNADGTGPPIYVVGDSTAGMHSPALEALAGERDAPLVLMNRSSCPFADLVVSVAGTDGMACHAAVQERQQWLLEQPAGVIFAANDLRMLTIDDVTMRAPATEVDVVEASGREQLWREAAYRTFAPLVAHGHRIVLMAPLPSPGAGETYEKDWDARGCPLLRVLTDSVSCGGSVDRAQALHAVELARTATSKLATELDADTIDVFDTLCPGSTCSATAGDRWMYWDPSHITNEASLMLTDELRGPVMSAMDARR